MAPNFLVNHRNETSAAGTGWSVKTNAPGKLISSASPGKCNFPKMQRCDFNLSTSCHEIIAPLVRSNKEISADALQIGLVPQERQLIHKCDFKATTYTSSLVRFTNSRMVVGTLDCLQVYYKNHENTLKFT